MLAIKCLTCNTKYIPHITAVPKQLTLPQTTATVKTASSESGHESLKPTGEFLQFYLADQLLHSHMSPPALAQNNLTMPPQAGTNTFMVEGYAAGSIGSSKTS